MKKRVGSFLLLVAILCMLMTPMASAAVDGIPYPRYEGLCNLNALLQISSSGKASCRCEGEVDLGYTVELFIELQQKSGDVWDTIADWNVSSSGSIREVHSYYVEKGYYYRVLVTAQIYDKNGKFVGPAYAKSASAYY